MVSREEKEINQQVVLGLNKIIDNLYRSFRKLRLGLLDIIGDLQAGFITPEEAIAKVELLVDVVKVEEVK